MKRTEGEKPARKLTAVQKDRAAADAPETVPREGYDYFRDKRRRLDRMRLIDVRKTWHTLYSCLSDLREIDSQHPDASVQREAGRILAGLTDSMQDALPKLRKTSAGFKERWERELHVKGRTTLPAGMKEVSLRILRIHFDVQDLLYTEVWNLVSSVNDQRPPLMDTRPDATFCTFLVALRDWPALRAKAAALESPQAGRSLGILSAMIEGRPLPRIPPRETKAEFVSSLIVEIEREIAGPRFNDYWREVVKDRARTIWMEYRNGLPLEKRKRTLYPAHALRTLKEAFLASIQR